MYGEVEYTERVEVCRTRIDESIQLIALREEAVSLFSQAEEALNQRSGFFDVAGYETARSLFEQSQKKWEEYNDPAQVAACKERIALCASGIADVERTKILFVIAGFVIVVCVGAAVIFVYRRKKTQK